MKRFIKILKSPISWILGAIIFIASQILWAIIKSKREDF